MVIRLLLNKEDQVIIREEIRNVIGNDFPDLQHRFHCHYTMAFISEVIRFHHVAPFSLPHRNIEKVQIGEIYFILSFINFIGVNLEKMILKIFLNED